MAAYFVLAIGLFALVAAGSLLCGARRVRSFVPVPARVVERSAAESSTTS
jgi:hypothetical protein